MYCAVRRHYGNMNPCCVTQFMEKKKKSSSEKEPDWLFSNKEIPVSVSVISSVLHMFASLHLQAVWSGWVLWAEESGGKLLHPPAHTQEAYREGEQPKSTTPPNGMELLGDAVWALLSGCTLKYKEAKNTEHGLSGSSFTNLLELTALSCFLRNPFCL